MILCSPRTPVSRSLLLYFIFLVFGFSFCFICGWLVDSSLLLLFFFFPLFPFVLFALWVWSLAFWNIRSCSRSCSCTFPTCNINFYLWQKWLIFARNPNQFENRFIWRLLHVLRIHHAVYKFNYAAFFHAWWVHQMHSNILVLSKMSSN